MKKLLKLFIQLLVLSMFVTPCFAASINKDTTYTTNAKNWSKYYQPRAVLVNRNQMRRKNYIFTPQQARYYGYRGVNGSYGTYRPTYGSAGYGTRGYGNPYYYGYRR